MESAHERQLRIALRIYLNAVGRLPCPGAFASFHGAFAELRTHNFRIPHKPWLNPYELAGIASYIALCGTTKKNNKPLFDISKVLNPLKGLWRLAEEVGEYSDNPNYEATFVLRWVYQQLPFQIHPLRVVRTNALVYKLFSETEVSDFVQGSTGFSGPDFLKTSMMMLDAFVQRSAYSSHRLLSMGDPQHVQMVLEFLAASRPERAAFYNSKLRLDKPAEKPYEINSLLRYPIVKYDYEYFAPYPELIGYASTRGLFFRFCEEGGEAFRTPFVAAFEANVAKMLRATLPAAEILTEEDERVAGWTGKTNDVTLISGDAALLIECKLSGLFVEAKRTAAPDAIIADIKKQIANGQSRKGLFQLRDKIQAVQTAKLPSALQEKYKNVTRFFPVLLLFDAIEHANSPVTLGNIVRDELLAYGVKDFAYQIWHFEELSWLTEYAGTALRKL